MDFKPTTEEEFAIMFTTYTGELKDINSTHLEEMRNWLGDLGKGVLSLGDVVSEIRSVANEPMENIKQLHNEYDFRIWLKGDIGRVDKLNRRNLHPTQDAVLVKVAPRYDEDYIYAWMVTEACFLYLYALPTQHEENEILLSDLDEIPILYPNEWEKRAQLKLTHKRVMKGKWDGELSEYYKYLIGLKK